MDRHHRHALLHGLHAIVVVVNRESISVSFWRIVDIWFVSDVSVQVSLIPPPYSVLVGGSTSTMTCVVCRNKCSLKELNSKLDRDLQDLFTDPSIVFERRISLIKQTIDFQQNHRDNLQKRQLEEVFLFYVFVFNLILEKIYDENATILYCRNGEKVEIGAVWDYIILSYNMFERTRGSERTMS